MTTNTVDVNSVVDKAKFTGFHLKVILWCLLVIVFDGYDLAINGVTLPLIMEEWSLDAVQGGMLASTALAGMMLGAMIFGTLADKIGRKKVIMICIVLFSGFTSLGGFSSSPTEFGILRFLAGLGIGGVMPNLVALTSEYAPKKLRSTLVTGMFSGYALGGVAAALLGSWYTASYGWQIMFYIAAIPLLFLPFIWKFLPESLPFLVNAKRDQEAREIIQRIAPLESITADSQLKLTEDKESAVIESGSVLALFGQHRTLNTLLFWLAFFMCLLTLYALGSWLPKLMMAAGYSLGSSLTFLLVLNIGAAIGTASGGMLADRFGLKPVIIIFCVAGALALYGLGFQTPQVVLYFFVAIAGASSLGTQILLYSYVAQYYPLAVRSTGIGWASAIGRMGAIVGPILIGVFLARHMPHHLNFIAVGVPLVIAGIAIMFIRHSNREQIKLHQKSLVNLNNG